MNSTIVQRQIETRFDWRPSTAEVEAIVVEMQPLIDALATGERIRLEQLITHVTSAA